MGLAEVDEFLAGHQTIPPADGLAAVDRFLADTPEPPGLFARLRGMLPSVPTEAPPITEGGGRVDIPVEPAAQVPTELESVSPSRETPREIREHVLMNMQDLAMGRRPADVPAVKIEPPRPPRRGRPWPYVPAETAVATPSPSIPPGPTETLQDVRARFAGIPSETPSPPLSPAALRSTLPTSIASYVPTPPTPARVGGRAIRELGVAGSVPHEVIRPSLSPAAVQPETLAGRIARRLGIDRTATTPANVARAQIALEAAVPETRAAPIGDVVPTVPPELAAAIAQRMERTGPISSLEGPPKSLVPSGAIAIRGAHDALKRESAELKGRANALQRELATLDRTSKEAVDGYNAKATALQGEFAAFTQKAEEFNRSVQGGPNALTLLPEQSPPPPEPTVIQRPLTPEAYIDLVNPNNRGVREVERLGNALVAGAIGTAGSMAQYAAYFTGSTEMHALAKGLADLRRSFETDDPTILQQAAGAVGSTLSFFLPGLAVAKGAQAVAVVSHRLAMWLGISAATGMEAIAEAGSVYEQMRAKGASRREAEMAANKTFWANPVVIAATNRLGLFASGNSPMVLGLAKSLRRVGGSPKAANVIAKQVLSGDMEAIQEGSQTITASTAMGEVADPKEVGLSMAMGFVATGGISAVQQQIRNLNAREIRTGRASRGRAEAALGSAPPQPTEAPAAPRMPAEPPAATLEPPRVETPTEAPAGAPAGPVPEMPAGSVGAVPIYRAGEEGRWWTLDREYSRTGWPGKEIREATLSGSERLLDLRDRKGWDAFIAQATPDEAKIIQDPRARHRDIQEQYDKILSRLGYDGFTMLDSKGDLGDEGDALTVYLRKEKVPTATKLSEIPSAAPPPDKLAEVAQAPAAPTEPSAPLPPEAQARIAREATAYGKAMAEKVEAIRAERPQIPMTVLQYPGKEFYALIHPSARGDAKPFRMTRFDERGWQGHQGFDSAELALRAAVEEGFDTLAPDQRILSKFSQGLPWRIGTRQQIVKDASDSLRGQREARTWYDSQPEESQYALAEDAKALAELRAGRIPGEGPTPQVPAPPPPGAGPAGPDVPPPAPGPAAPKQAWEMTKGEWFGYLDSLAAKDPSGDLINPFTKRPYRETAKPASEQPLARSEHRDQIRQALARGYTIPPAVLAEYPGLAAELGGTVPDLKPKSIRERMRGEPAAEAPPAPTPPAKETPGKLSPLAFAQMHMRESRDLLDNWPQEPDRNDIAYAKGQQDILSRLATEDVPAEVPNTQRDAYLDLQTEMGHRADSIEEAIRLAERKHPPGTEGAVRIVRAGEAGPVGNIANMRWRRDLLRRLDEAPVGSEVTTLDPRDDPNEAITVRKETSGEWKNTITHDLWDPEPVETEEGVTKGTPLFDTPNAPAALSVWLKTPERVGAELPLTTPAPKPTVEPVPAEGAVDEQPTRTAEPRTRGERPGPPRPADTAALPAAPPEGAEAAPGPGGRPGVLSERAGAGPEPRSDAEGQAPAGRTGGTGRGSVLPEGERERVEEPSPPTQVSAEVTPKPGHTSQPSDRPGRDYVITHEDKIGVGSEKEKYDANVAAIELLQKLEAENRLATPEEQAVLVKYVGWGGMPNVFDQKLDPEHYWGKSEREKRRTDAARFDKVKALLTPEEWEAAAGSTQNAHYTSEDVVRAIWDALDHMGIRRLATKLRIIEPAIGIGHFFGMMPEGLAAHSMRAGVELDPITGRIARQLYQSADIHVKGFQDVIVPDNFYHLFVSNVPFANTGVYDPAYKRDPLKTSSVHNYYFFKAVDKAPPGGVIAFITSRYTLDGYGENARRIRELIREKADLLGAIRLPYTAFKATAGTEVVTDIVFLRKRAPGETPHTTKWLDVKEVKDAEGNTLTVTADYRQVPALVNEYFVDNPRMVLGTHAATGTMRHAGMYNVEPLSRPLAESFAKAITHLPTDALTPIKARDLQTKETREGGGEMLEGAYGIKDGKLWRKHGTTLERVDVGPDAMARVKTILALRDIWKGVVELQLDPNASDDAIAKAQIALNKAYDKFVAEYGILHSPKNERVVIQDDPEFYHLMGLEQYDSEKKTATKADIFFKRTIPSRKPVQSVESARDALIVSLNEAARIDLGRMQELTGKDEAVLLEELGETVFHNPEGEWETSDIYLSGNVRQKLAAARAAGGTDPQYRRNIEALEKVIPADIPPSQIGIRLGSPWVPVEYVRQFVAELVGVRLHEVDVEYNAPLATWTVKSDWGQRMAKARQEYGTDDFDAIDLINKGMNHRHIQIKRTVREGDREVTFTDKKATNLAREKLAQIKKRFGEWAWEDGDRATHLTRIYNDEMNAHVPWVVDGSHLTLPGAAIAVKQPWTHQLDWIWRGIRGGNFLLAGEPGTGKTLAMAATVMELRRIGVRRKPMVVVEKTSLEQFANQWQQFYPAARLLVARKEDLTPANRKEFLGRATNGDWDAILVTREQFTKIPMSDEAQKAYITEQLQELQDAITAADIRERQDAMSTGARTRKSTTVKQLEAAKDRLEAQLQKLIDAPQRDLGMVFEGLGIDFLVADEAHAYKNLFFVTKLEHVKGLPNSKSQRSMDMYLKTRHINKINNGTGGILFATGTPLTNAISEIYNIQRYLQPNLLRELGLEKFGAWAHNFGEIVQQDSYGPTGEVERHAVFGEFSNVPELSHQLRQSMEFMTSEEASKLGNFPLPEIEYVEVLSPRSEPLAEFIKSLKDRADAIKRRNRPPQKGDDIILTVNIDGKKAAMDMRLVDPNATEEADGKINKAAENIVRIWKEGKADKTTQIVFIDYSVPLKATTRTVAPTGPKWPKFKVGDTITWEPTEGTLRRGTVVTVSRASVTATTDAGRVVIGRDKVGTLRTVNGEVIQTASTRRASPTRAAEGFSFYDALKAKLLKGGIPAHEIAMIQEVKPEERHRIYDKVNKGEIRVLMGSRIIIGISINVQERMVAGHQIDPPYRPDQIGQSNARFHRPGNMHRKVTSYNYITQKSYDAKLWSLLARKARFTNQLLRNPTFRTMVDIGPVDLNYNEIAAIATDNPDLMRRVEVESDLDRLYDLRSSWQEQQNKAIHDQRDIPKTIRSEQARLKNATAIVEHLKNAPKAFALRTAEGKEITEREKAGEAILEAAQLVWGKWGQNREFEYKGYKVVVAGSNTAHGTADATISTVTPLGNIYSRLYEIEGAWVTEKKKDGTEKTTWKHKIVLLTPKGVIASMEGTLANQQNVPEQIQRTIHSLEKDLESANRLADKPFEYEKNIEALQQELGTLRERMGDSSAAAQDAENALTEMEEMPEEESEEGEEPPTDEEAAGEGGVTLGAGLGGIQALFGRRRQTQPGVASPDARVEAVLSGRQRAGVLGQLAQYIKSKRDEYAHDYIAGWVLRRFPALRNSFRLAKDFPDDAKRASSEDLVGILGNLTVPKYEVFRRLVILRDLAATAAEGKTLPAPTPDQPPLDADEIDAEIARLTPQASPEVELALARHDALMQEHGQEMVRRGLIKPEQARDHYFPHHVWDYTDNLQIPGMPRHLHKQWRGYVQSREGSARAINVDYLGVMWGHLNKFHLHNLIDDFTLDTLRENDETDAIREAMLERLEGMDHPQAEEIAGTWRPQPGERQEVDGQVYEGYQFRKGRSFYPTQTVPEDFVDRIVTGAVNSGGKIGGVLIDPPGGPVKESVRGGLAVGQPFKTYMIPIELSAALQQFREPDTSSELARGVRAGMRVWKRTVLGLAGLPFQYMNYVGDLVNLYAEDPSVGGIPLASNLGGILSGAFLGGAVLGPVGVVGGAILGAAGGAGGSLIGTRHARRAVKSAIAKQMNKTLSDPTLQEWYETARQQRVVSGSTFVGAEVDRLILMHPELRRFLSFPRRLWQSRLNPVNMLDIVSQVREEIPRLSKFFADMERIGEGNPVVVSGTDIRGLTPVDAAGKAARTFTVDYGNTTRKYDANVRGLLFPFATFYHGNFFNWANRMRRAPLKMSLLFGVPLLAMWLWNNTAGEEQEERLPVWYRYLPHINTMYQTEDGRDIIIALQTPVDMAARMIGLDQMPWLIGEVHRGKKTWQEAIKELVRNMGVAPLAQHVQLLGPIFRSLLALAPKMGSQPAVDVTSGRPLVPKSLQGSKEGWNREAQWHLEQFIAPYAQYMRADRSDKLKEVEDPLIRSLLLGFFDAERAAGVRRYDPTVMRQKEAASEREWLQQQYSDALETNDTAQLEKTQKRMQELGVRPSHRTIRERWRGRRLLDQREEQRRAARGVSP